LELADSDLVKDEKQRVEASNKRRGIAHTRGQTQQKMLYRGNLEKWRKR